MEKVKTQIVVALTSSRLKIGRRLLENDKTALEVNKCCYTSCSICGNPIVPLLKK